MRLTREELMEAYKGFTHEKIIRLAKKESKSLRDEAVLVLESEILRRNLDQSLLHWAKLERDFFQGEELESLKKY
ncbi:hypothetical protein [Bergeyella sp. RCAD1439]|uniref:hypothetical protein n=1 Tax=Bergeyella anatis TaxID=3113737 RepID=UPI002E174179|nr:hypothetical protein [Bergeyella sp. RCAD1439]